ncbi:MAG: transcriptional repressor [Gammaproteobacteria bacterium]|nr:transcriptional repressor [Gammaproteobacteria bacterium]
MDEQALTDKLLNHAVGVTPQRLRIAAVMLDAPRHLSADQVLAKLNRDGGGVSKATVYNTLRTFTEHGLLREINVDGQRSFYDSTVAPHHHFYNPETGELMDIRADRIKVSGLPQPPDGTEAAEVEVIIRLRKRPAV